MNGSLTGLNWPAFATCLAVELQPGDDEARIYALAESIEAGALAGVNSRAARQQEQG